MEATHWRGQSYESQVLRQVARGPPPHPCHSDPLATKKLLPLTVHNLEWEPLRPSCKKLSLDVVGKKPEDHASQFAPGRCLLHQRWPRKHPHPHGSSPIQPHPTTWHGHKLNLRSSQTHMTIENDFPAHKTILYTFTLTRCIFQEAIQPHLYTETRSAQHQWLHPNPPQPAQEHRWCLRCWKIDY